MELGREEQRVAIEAIATLVKIKRAMAELLLKPAGVPDEVYAPILSRRDPYTGRALTKREMGPLILDALGRLPGAEATVHAIVEMAARWDRFHLAEDEYAARATVQKAQDILADVRNQTLSQREQQESIRRERELAEFRQQSNLLLMMFDELSGSKEDPQRRGYLLQDLLNRLCALHGIPVLRSFVRNAGAEQIDGAFRFDGWHYLVECRWRQALSDIRELDGLLGQVERSGKQTMGLFLSVNGWSPNVPGLLKQNAQKCIVLMDGYDVRCVLTMAIDLCELLRLKIGRLNVECEPFLSARDCVGST